MENTYEFYADASGDEGVGKPGSSPCLVMAFLICRSEDVDHNAAVTKDLKDKYCRNAPELKWQYVRKKLKRYNEHRREVLDHILSRTKAELCISATTDKTILHGVLRSDLNLFHHLFPMTVLQDHFTAVRAREPVMGYIDDGLGPRAKKFLLTELQKDAQNGNHKIELLFCDSRRYLLIQLADVFAGLVADWLVNVSSQSLPLCQRCAYPGQHRSDCSWATGRKKIHRLKDLQPARARMLHDSSGKAVLRGFVALPLEQTSRFKFIDCLL